jgi:hypothetical protein
MDKGLAGLLGAIGALAVASPSHAATSAPVDLDEVMRANSYADLLKPIPNPVAVRQALDERNAAQPAAPDVMTVQYYRHHHHHHHHHRYYRRRHHHHHHHHGLRIGPLVIR